MKKKVFITVLIILILLSCMMGIAYFTYPKDKMISLSKENVINTNENTMDISTNNNISDEVTKESNTTIPEVEIETKKDEETPKKDSTIVEKTASTVNTSNSTTKNAASNDKNIQKNNEVNNKDATSKATTSPSTIEKTTPKETTTSKPVDKPTETKKETQPTRCTHNNNHGIDVGNCGKWFNSKSEAIAYYEEKVNYWSNLWESYQIEDSEYYKNCPTGYEYWSCMYCNKWTINLYYR